MPIITYSSVPDFDNWGPDTFWDCPDWITWHKALVNHYGKIEADSRFAYTWQQRSAFGHELTCSLYDAAFISYFKQQGYQWDPLSGLIVNITQTVGNIGSGLNNLTKIASFVIPLLFILAAAGLIIWANKKYKIA